jgi:hypothetical protein
LETGYYVGGFEEGVHYLGDIFGVWRGDAFVDCGFGYEVALYVFF